MTSDELHERQLMNVANGKIDFADAIFAAQWAIRTIDRLRADVLNWQEAYSVLLQEVEEED